MGEYAEYQLQYEMRRGFKSKPSDGVPYPRSPITAKCDMCGKETRSVAGDPLAGLRSHMKSKHGVKI